MSVTHARTPTAIAVKPMAVTTEYLPVAFGYVQPRAGRLASCCARRYRTSPT